MGIDFDPSLVDWDNPGVKHLFEHFQARFEEDEKMRMQQDERIGELEEGLKQRDEKIRQLDEEIRQRMRELDSLRRKTKN